MRRIRTLLAACAVFLLAACASTGPAGEGNRLEWINPSTAGQCNQAYTALVECKDRALRDGQEAVIEQLLQTPLQINDANPGAPDMSFMTNRGKARQARGFWRGEQLPTQFHRALITRGTVQTLNNAAAVDAGGGLVDIAITGHGYAVGDRIGIAGSTNYDGHHYVTAVPDVNTIRITTTFQAETFAGTEEVWHAPGVDTNTLSELSEIAAGNGYSAGGIALTRDATGWPTLTEDDTNDRADLVAANGVYTASGGPIPASGAGAAYEVITDDNATVGNREVLMVSDLNDITGHPAGTEHTVSAEQSFTVQSATVRAEEAA